MGYSTGAGVDPGIFDQIRSSQAPGMDAEAIETILRGYFSGNRDSLRECKFLDLKVQARHGVFNGMCVDISRSGMLLRIVDPAFATPDEMSVLMPYTARVWYHLQGGFTVLLGNDGVRSVADVVRVTGYCGRGQSLILIGTRFRSPLTPDQCRLIGVEYSSDRAPGT